MRQPSTDAKLYAWHHAAMMNGGKALDIHEGQPECGWFKMRLVKGGPWVPVEIFIVRETDDDTGELLGPEEYRARYDGLTVPAQGIWTYLQPISREEHDAILQRQHDLPVMQATRVKIDLTEEPIRP